MALEDEVEPMLLLGGLNALQVWDSINFVFLGWLCLVFAPRWRYTRFVTVLPPLFHSAIYALGIISLMLFPANAEESSNQLDFGSLKGVVEMFRNPNVVFIGWIHYIAFDLLVGRMIVFDSIERKASTKFHIFIIVPILFFTFMLGPTGYISYMIVRQIFLPEVPRNEGPKIKSV